MTRSIALRLLPGALSILLAPAAAVGQSDAAQSNATAAPKATQICLAPVAVEAAPTGMDPVTAVRDAFTNFLTGPSLAVQPLSARLQSQVREEAKLAGCRFLLLPSIKHERKTGGGLLGKVAGGAVQQGAWAVTGSAGSTVGRVVAGAAAGAASSAVSDYAYGSRSKDELTLKYRLESGSGAVLEEKSEKRKAKSDGEDLLTPVVQQAAEAVVEAAAKHREGAAK
jgi:hypothetical protein